MCLGIETSCDETAAAVLTEGRIVLSSVVSSQDDIHRRYGGVVPELAARHHLEAILPVIDRAVTAAGAAWDALDLVAVTCGPGLPAALLVGLAVAKALAFGRGLPVVGVNHLLGHLFALSLRDENTPDRGIGWPIDLPSDQDLPRPAVGLVVSGSHTDLCYLPPEGGLRVLGTTLDDAAGEAFDKVARLIGLPYPGGPALDRLAATGDPSRIAFPRTSGSLEGPRGGLRGVAGELAFSFSGLKTAVALRVERGQDDPADIAASFQQAVVDTLVMRAMAALQRTSATTLLVAGGVAANSCLRGCLERACAERGVHLHIPPLRYCTDNAAMIAAAGWARLAATGPDNLDLDAAPDLSLEMSSRRGAV